MVKSGANVKYIWLVVFVRLSWMNGESLKNKIIIAIGRGEKKRQGSYFSLVNAILTLGAS